MTEQRRADVGAEEVREEATWWQLVGCLGCGLMLVAVFLVSWSIQHRIGAAVIGDPDAVEEALAAIVDATPPPGYVGFRGFRGDGERSIAVLVPDAYVGAEFPVTQPLTISAWRFPAGVPASERQAEIEAFWEERVRRRLGGPVEVAAERPVALEVRGAEHPGRERLLVAGGRQIRTIVGLVPARSAGAASAEGPGDGAIHVDREDDRVGELAGELVGLAFVGDAERFDEAALRAFLGSIE